MDFGGEPVVGDFCEDGAGEAQEGGFVWEDGGDAGAAFEFLVDALQGVGGAQAALVGGGQLEDGKALRKVFLHPSGKLWGGGGISGDDFLKPGLGVGAIRGEEDAADVGGDLGAQIEAWDMGLGILLEVELAALPEHGGEDGAAGGGEAGMVVANEELEAAEAALLEALEKVAPVDLGFAEGDASTEDLALAIGADAEGDEHGAVDDRGGGRE